ncbi:lysosomal thioesterase PPT2 isoform X2 [Rattus norvegicus]|uniref:lysosomal thioesterase PPT2 isoform X2 n=1 Tax=Rattus norvegicus TaxID=10116 RepID=UPI0019170A6F|nr:lysosomal thioesterase PPT2 isoform X2 [Rattus norvegicus]
MPGLWRQRLPSAWALLLLPFLPLLLPAAPAPHRGSYKPVIVVHGLFDSSYSFRHLLDYINEMGQYGDTDYLKWLFPTSMRSNLYRICYSPWGQEFSICNYWHDPHHDDLYLNASSFLALINGERDHPNATAWRKNFLRVGRLVLIGGPDDGVITPWQSSFFGFYDANETVLEMEEQPVYLRDSFGLKTLLARGAIVRCPMAGVSHTTWHSNRTLYDACIEPWLS